MNSIMEIYGEPWISMVNHGYPWLSMDIHGFPWATMDIHDQRWICMANHGYPWVRGRISLAKYVHFQILELIPGFSGFSGFLEWRETASGAANQTLPNTRRGLRMM